MRAARTGCCRPSCVVRAESRKSLFGASTCLRSWSPGGCCGRNTAATKTYPILESVVRSQLSRSKADSATMPATRATAAGHRDRFVPDAADGARAAAALHAAAETAIDLARRPGRLARCKNRRSWTLGVPERVSSINRIFAHADTSTGWSPNRQVSNPAWGWTAQRNFQQMPVRWRWRRSPMRKPV
jgi:hypothetical protein